MLVLVRSLDRDMPRIWRLCVSAVALQSVLLVVGAVLGWWG